MTIQPLSEFVEFGRLWRAAKANDTKLGPPDNDSDRDLAIVDLEYNIDAEMGIIIVVRKSKWDEKKRMNKRARLTLVIGILQHKIHDLICKIDGIE